jgi:hypothetical protein
MHMMRHDQQTTIFGIIFWVLFLTSIGLGFVTRYQWLDVAWVLAGYAIAAIASVFLSWSFSEIAVLRVNTVLGG